MIRTYSKNIYYEGLKNFPQKILKMELNTKGFIKKGEYITILSSSLLIILFAAIANAANIYVDQTLGSDCTSGNYSTASRACNGANGNAYNTIQEAVNAAAVGDTIYMRGGTYNTSNIDIPETKNGTAWTAGNFTTLSSYPGEWAIINGGGTTSYNCIRHTTGYNKRTGTNATRYWKFERMELTGCRNGLWFTEGPLWIRYNYIHDNHPGTADEPEAGIWINLARENIIEYNYLDNNGVVGGTANYSNIGFDADYRDDETPTEFDPNHATRKNIIRYNYIKGTNGIHYKNQQRFGTNTRTSAGVIASYADWGDKIHHNIIEDSHHYGITCDQDNCQIYNNIIDGSATTPNAGVQIGWETYLSSSVPRILNGVSYNNTIIHAQKSLGNSSGCNKDSDTCVDDGGSGAAPVPYTWHYNNISYQNQSNAEQGLPIGIAAEVASGRVANMTNVYIKNNLIHSPAISGNVFLRGRASYYSLSSAQSAFPTVSGNWQNTTSGLFQGTTGVSKYLSSPGFVLNGSTTISNGGIGGNHPYLSGVTLPNYVGATNPNDNAWVSGVLGLVDTNVLKAGGAGDPSWIEGSGVPLPPTNLQILP